MPGNFVDFQPRKFDPAAIVRLSGDAREAVNTALKAMATWRNEVASANGKNGKDVIDKMAAAAAALGWPEQVVDVARTQFQTIADLQIKTMDRMLDAWEEQVKLPNAMTAPPTTMLNKLGALPNSVATGGWPSADSLQQAATNPLQFWMQMAEHSQKVWSETIALWGKAAKPH
jgi:hypothetical protein